MQDSQMNTRTLFAQLLAQQLADSCSGTSFPHHDLCLLSGSPAMCYKPPTRPRKEGRREQEFTSLALSRFVGIFFSWGGPKFFLFSNFPSSFFFFLQDPMRLRHHLELLSLLPLPRAGIMGMHHRVGYTQWWESSPGLPEY